MSEKNTTMIPAIVLGSHTMGLAIIRSLGQVGVPVIVVCYGREDMGYRSKYVKECLFTESPESSEDAFLDVLLHCNQKYGKCVVFPSDDASLWVVAKNKAYLSAYHFLACPDWELVNLVVDKKRTYALAAQNDIPSPRTMVPEDESEVESFCELIGYPCLIKPCLSHRYYDHFKKKMTRVENLQQALAAYREAAAFEVEVMVQELIPGGDTLGVNYNSFVFGDDLPVEFVAEKVRLSPPGFGVPRVVKSKWIPEVAEAGQKTVRSFGYQGYSCTEFKRDPRDGTYKLMELNGRHNRSSLLSLKCGINFPFIEYQSHVEGVCLKQVQSDTEYMWIDEFRDLYQTFVSAKEESLGVRRIIEPYVNKHVFAVFDRRDLAPFAARVQGLLKQMVSQEVQDES